MSDVFISYKSENRDAVSRLAHALERQGWSVWWDRELVPGDLFDRVIERELRSARAVVVVWSHAAVSSTSDYVENEAKLAKELHRLCPVRIDDCELPMVFRQIQTPHVDLDGALDGQASFQQLCRAIRARMESTSGSYASVATPIRNTPVAATPAADSRPNPPRAGRRTQRLVAIAGVSLVVIAAALWAPGRLRVPPDAREQMDSNAAAAGFTLMRSLEGKLRAKVARIVPVSLPAEGRYLILGTCYGACRDIDLGVDAPGIFSARLSDSAVGPSAQLPIGVSKASPVRVHVTLFDCDGECRYDVRIYRGL